MGWVFFLIVLLITPVWAQSLRLLDCGEINFFGPACVTDPPAAPVPLLPEPPLAQPLFPPQTMATDTPPLMYDLLNHPTPENARAFLEWQARRQQRIAEVQKLLHALSQERKHGK